MGEKRGTKALELWCRRMTDGYPGVHVQNMTTSWRDGLAFCAMIHHFRPDLIDFNSLNKDDVYRNNELAFRTAEQHLGIPALLDAADMASCAVPDRLSILTYLSQFYQTFGGSSPNRLATNRTIESTEERIAPVPESPKPKVESRLGMRRDLCVACGLPVFLAEKLLIARAPYHRTCFRCARCGNQLTPGNYYETEEGQYCCETCPDEERSNAVHRNYTSESTRSDENRENDELSRPLSDEEKAEQQGVQNISENAAMPDLISHTSQMRKRFMVSHLLSENLDESSAKNMSVTTQEVKANYNYRRADSAFPDDDDDENEEEEEETGELEGAERTEEEQKDICNTDSSDLGKKLDVKQGDVYSALDSLNVKSGQDQRSAAISFHDTIKNREENTKDLSADADQRTNSEVNLSLVQKRLKIFEAQNRKADHIERTNRSKNVSKITSLERSSMTQDVNAVQDKSCFSTLDVLRIYDDQLPEKKFEEDTSINNTDKCEKSYANVAEDGKEEDSTMMRDHRDLEGTLRNTRNVEGREEGSSKNVTIMNNDEHSGSRQLEECSKVRDIESARSIAKIEGKRGEDVETDEELFDTAIESSLLTAKGIDLSANEDYPEDLNPFKSDEEDMETRRQIAPGSFRSSKVSTNPFDSEEEEERELPKPAARSKLENMTNVTKAPTKRLLSAPQINLNPFWSDEEEEVESDTERHDKTTQGNMPIPKPRTFKTISEASIISHTRSDLHREGVYASNGSITSSESATTPGGTCRKKKPAPQPPVAKVLLTSEHRILPMLKSSYDTLSPHHNSSPGTTPRGRKTKPAPPPPMSISTVSCNVPIGSALSFDESPVYDDNDQNMWRDQKINKDEANRNRQSLTNISCADDISCKPYPDKSIQGKWKRKKGPAPPRPIPHRRKIKVISMKDVKLELDEIELQQQGLERQGVRLEQLIRDKCESGSRTDDSSLGTDVEELVLELFALVNEKNELFRRQAELMLLRRQQRLEEEHAEVEYQIRCLMYQPEATKTDFDKQREEALIQRLVEIVERRNEIVECLEMDRRREVEEDRSINKHMSLFAARNNELLSSNNDDSSSIGKTKKEKMKEKSKERKPKKITKKDADKDVDETEMKIKRHSKRRWF